MRILKIVITLILVCLIVGLVYNSVWQSQGDSNYKNIYLNIDNQSPGLWESSKIDTCWFMIEGLVIDANQSKLKIGGNPSFDVFLSEYDKNQKELFPEGFELFVKDTPIKSSKKGNRLHCSLSYNDILSINKKNNTVNSEGDIEDANIVFGLIAPNKESTHYRLNFWLEKGSFDIASGDGFNNTSNPIYFTVEVNNQTATSIIVTLILFVLIFTLLLCWFFLLKKEFYPTFSTKGQLYVSKPASDTITLQENARQLIIGNKIKAKENFFTRIFLGKIQYILTNEQHSAVLTPYRHFKSKKVLYKLRTKHQTTMNTQSEKSYLVHGNNYSLQTEKDIFSFEYFNIKHQ
jgi:hypothetical protein